MNIFKAQDKNKEKIFTGEIYLDKKKEQVRKELEDLKKISNEIEEAKKVAVEHHFNVKKNLSTEISNLRNEISILEKQKKELMAPIDIENIRITQLEKVADIDRKLNEIKLKEVELKERSNGLLDIEINLGKLKDSLQLRELDLVRQEKVLKEKLLSIEEDNKKLIESKVLFEDYKSGRIKELEDQTYFQKIKSEELKAKEYWLQTENKRIESEATLLKSRQETFKQVYNLWKTQKEMKTEQL